MTTRVLPPEEWARLAATELGPALAQLPANATTVFVAESAGEIVGCWSLVMFAHVEGLWIAPAHRKRGRVLLRLWERLRALTAERGLGAVFTGSLSDEVTQMLMARGAAALPPMFVLPVRPVRG